ncbi:MAG: arginine--tRNA ligase [Candidatus Moranbacteria bacterium]|nr:arginine--tRNA ligase [Candidatus Moranbacteria bacterium]
MKKQIQLLIQNAIKSAYGIDFDIKKIKVDYPPEGMGDFATNVALLLAKIIGKGPMEVAEELKGAIRGLTSSALEVRPRITGFEKIEVAKPGFLNFYLSKKTIQDTVTKINEEKNNFGSSKIGTGKKIHLDFVSANPTGPVHIGNARGGPLGDVLANIFQKTGYDPYREYYVNDAGNQVDILGHSILGDAEAQYNGEYIEEIKKKLSFEELRANSEQGKSLALEKDARKIGEEGAQIVLEDIIKPSMEKFGINFDNWFSEKELQGSGKVDEIINILKEKGLVYEKDGALWFKSMEFGDDKDRVVIKSTGEKTYFGSDIAYHKKKLDRGFEKLIDIWGADHHGDVKRVKGAMKALGYEDKLDIILTQFVRVLKDGKEMKMSKRAGTYVSVDDLIDEVGCDATRFFFLMHSADTHMNFDMDLAKERSEKNPVYYIQYAHARISSILEKAALLRSDLRSVLRSDLRKLHAKERALIFELLKFPDLVEEISQNYAVHYLPQYAMGLADKFHSFYSECRVIDESNLELTAARLELVKAVQIVLAEVLRLMGISVPEKM